MTATRVVRMRVHCGPWKGCAYVCALWIMEQKKGLVREGGAELCALWTVEQKKRYETCWEKKQKQNRRFCCVF